MSFEFGPIGLILLQTNSLCNLNCSYCYIPTETRQENHLLPLTLIEPVFEKLFLSPYFKGKAQVLWHAGEPLTASISYYTALIQKVNALKDKLKLNHVEITFGLRTNATLINQAWCDFFKEYKVHVTVSCDGPEKLHNAYRKDWQGKGSFSQTLKGMQCLKENGFQLNVLSVLTPETLAEDPETFLTFFQKLEVHMLGFNPLERKEGGQEDARNDWRGNQNFERQYEIFLKKMLQIIQDNPHKHWPIIREMRNAYTILLGLEVEKNYVYGDVLTPFSVVAIDNRANFTTFSPDLLTTKSKEYGDFILGNLLETTLEGVVQTNKFHSIYQDIRAGIEACRNSCDYFNACGGGTPDPKYTEHGTFTAAETSDCRYRVIIPTEIAIKSLEEVLQ